MNSKVKYLLCPVFFFVANYGIAQEENSNPLSLKGYIKNLQSVTFFGNSDSLLTSNLIHNRLNFRWNMPSQLYARLEIRNRVFFGEQVRLTPGFGKHIAEDPGYANFSKLWINQPSLVAVSNIDRALLNYSSGKFSLTAGRQRVNWGINTVWNPNDLFNAYNFLDFDYEERPGSDAIRIQFFPNAFSSADLVYKASEIKNEQVVAALFKFNKWKYDFQFLGGLYYNDLAIGTGWAGNIKDAGFKGEATFFRNKNDLAKADDQFTASILFDYSFEDSWYISVSGLYLQNPAPAILMNMNPTTDYLSAKFLMPYQWSIYASALKAFTPILSGNLAIIFSPEEHDLIIFPTVSYSVAQNFDLDLTAQNFFSDSYAPYYSVTSVYLRMRWSF